MSYYFVRKVTTNPRHLQTNVMFFLREYLNRGVFLLISSKHGITELIYSAVNLINIVLYLLINNILSGRSVLAERKDSKKYVANRCQ